MLEKFDSLSRHVVGNRRRHRRRPIKYDTILRDAAGREVFRGKTTNLSQSGAQISGFVSSVGIADGQRVLVEFLVLPRDCAQPAARAPVVAGVTRYEETPDTSVVAVIFDDPLGG
jgi:hypothetical protein